MIATDLAKEQENEEKKDSTDNLVKALDSKIGTESDALEAKTKTSFYITKHTQIFLKQLSKIYGLPQGEIINQAPLLFAEFAKRSLDRRKRSVATLRTLAQQIQSSIEAMQSVAPHLSGVLDYPANMISQLVNLEEKAVEDKVISGLGVKKDGQYGNLDFPLFYIDEPFESELAYKRDLDELEVGEDPFLIICKKLLQKEAGDEHKDDEPRTDSE